MNHIFRFLSAHRRTVLLVIYICIIAALWHLPGVFHPKSVEDVRQWVTGFGVWGNTPGRRQSAAMKQIYTTNSIARR